MLLIYINMSAVAAREGKPVAVRHLASGLGAHLQRIVLTTGRRWSNVPLYHAVNGEPGECDPRWRGSAALRIWLLQADNEKAVPKGAAFCLSVPQFTRTNLAALTSDHDHLKVFRSNV